MLATTASKPHWPTWSMSGVLLAVFAALIVLTTITVAVSYFDFGPFNLIVAIGVATIKAALVALWFMHLRYDSGLNALIFLVGVAFLGLFMAIAMLDSVQYQPNVQKLGAEQSSKHLLSATCPMSVYWRLIRPGLLMTVLFSMAIAALTTAEPPPWARLTHALLGTAC